jgi:SAM-dependent methyltransferase
VSVSARRQIIASETIYDHPRYYDILFGWDRSKEADFYSQVFERCGVAAGEPILEVACGTGRVARLLAQRRWKVTGIDVRPGMVAFLRECSTSTGAAVETLCGDMTTFSTERESGAAYNPMSSFGFLQSDAAADAHLQRMAAALRSGGVYVLDMDFQASAEEMPTTTDESWEMTQGNVTVRAENDAVYVNDEGVTHTLAWGLEGHLRSYTSTTFARRVQAAAGFRIESWHPERNRATGVSEFSVAYGVEPPIRGRAMVVLRRGRG